MAWVKLWNTVVFSDEEKFNLDGPDGYNYYFHDLRKKKRFLNRNLSSIGGVMNCELQFVSSKMNAITYKGVIEKRFNILITYLDQIHGHSSTTMYPFKPQEQ